MIVTNKQEKRYLDLLNNAIKLMQPTTAEYNERGDRIMKLEMLLEKLRLECVSRGLYSMKDMIEEVL